MRPEGLTTKVFLDGCDPEETEEILKILGFLDGQTTNPTLLSRNPIIKKKIEDGKKFTRKGLLWQYQDNVRKISGLIPDGSVSVEVYADRHTSSRLMIDQAVEMHYWIENAHIKFPTTTAGLEAAVEATKLKMNVNMTLCFDQSQGVGVHAATRSVNNNHGLYTFPTSVYISPFVGRLDDKGYRGMDLVQNLRRMYNEINSHVKVLGASIRSVKDLKMALKAADIVTAPFSVLKEWGEAGMPLTVEKDERNLKPIPYIEIEAREFNNLFYPFGYPLIGKGLQAFADDWNKLLIDFEKYDRR